MALPTLAEYRARGIVLPTDDLAAQEIIDGEEAWLARKLKGALEGSRAESFHVGYSRTTGKLGLSRYTDSVAITDGGTTVPSAQYRLVDSGGAVERIEPHTLHWTGPYVTVTYTPSDLDEIRRALFDLVALSAQPLERYASETIGSYSYSGGGASSRSGSRGVIVSSLIPVRDPLVCLYPVSRRLSIEDPVINRAELPL